MIHRCKVQCHTMNPAEMNMLGIKEDSGKWLPFAIDLSSIDAIKMSTDEEEEPTYNCSTIFCRDGSSYILDTPYFDLVDKWEELNNDIWGDRPASRPNDQEPPTL